MKRWIGLVPLATGLMVAATAPLSAAGYAPPTVRQIMLGLTVPASNTLFQVEEPEYDADLYWESVAAAAIMLAESGRMLQQESLAEEGETWMTQARRLVETSLKTAEAARTRDVDAVYEAGFAVYDTCDACHREYLAAPDAQ